MSDSLRLSHRAVAASAAFLLTGLAFAAPAAAGDGKKGGKGDRGASQGRSQGRSEEVKSSSGAKTGGGSAQDPAGNNGTFKVDGLPYDEGMANEPHVACGFRLKLFGFDLDQVGDVTIAGHAPSGAGTVASLAGVTFSDDAAGGGPNDADATFEFTEDDLDLTGLTAHDQQGYHLKVTLATGEPGGVKHKVFWFEPCQEEAVPAETGGAGVTTPATTPTVGAVDETVESREVVLGTTATKPGAAPAASVLGTRFERGVGALPLTGSVAGTLLALGGGLVVLGGGAWVLGRRLRHLA